MGNNDSKPDRPPRANPNSVNYNFRNDVSAQQQIRVQHENHNISIVQGQNSTGTQVQSQANVNAQRIQTSYNATQQSTEIKYNPFIAYSTETTVTNIPDRDDPFNNASRIRMNAPPIPPLPKKNFANNILNEVPTSSTHEKLPAPLVPVKKQEASGSLSKSPSIILKEVPTSSTHVKLHTPLGLVQKQEQFKLHPTESVSHRKVSLNSVNDFLTLKASIRDVKDPNFLQFHKELNKTKPLSDVRLSLINNQHLSDVTLIVGDNEETIYAHKMFLITASSLFLTQFEGKNEVYMILDKIEPVILLEVLKYCYTNQVNITEQNVLDLLKAADYLKVRQLSNVCHLFITNLFNENSIFMIFEKALEQKNELFEKKCINYMLKNEEKCFSSKGFYKIGFSSLLDIVGKCKFSNDKNEEIIKKWNYGEENMVFTASESKIMPKPNDSSAKSKGKQRNNPGKASTSDTFGSVKDLASNHNQTEDFVFHDDDNESIISKDDDIEMKTQLWFNGPKKQIVSEFSRLDLSCNKSILLHEIGFTTDLAKYGNVIKLSVSIFEGDHRSDIHHRTMNIDRRGMKINFVKFTRTPLKFYIGQKFFIKVNFVGPVSVPHVTGDNFSHSGFFETRKDVNKNYLNCVSYLIISDMPRN